MEIFLGYILYIHTNIKNNKKYIGITSRTLENRSNNGHGYKRCSRFWKAIQEDGWNNFDHQVILTDLTVDEANAAEKEYISKYKTLDPQYGYNIFSGGGCSNKRTISNNSWGKVLYVGIKEEYRKYTLYELTKLLQVDPALIRDRITRYGWSADEAFGFVNHVSTKPVTDLFYFGNQRKEFYGMSLYQICKKLNLEYKKIKNRIRYGKWSMDEALEFVPKTKTWCKLFYIGDFHQYDGMTVYEVCKMIKMNYRTVRGRITQYGMSIDKALELNKVEDQNDKTRTESKKHQNKPNNIRYFGIKTEYNGKTLAELSDILNLKPGTVYNRINVSHWTMDQAFGFVPRPIKSKSTKIYSGSVKKYNGMNLGDLANLLNIPYEKVYHRVFMLHWTMDEALEFVPRKKIKKTTSVFFKKIKLS